jgi:hypothetical protein
MREYNELEGCKWGKYSGSKGNCSWNECWDMSSEAHYENKAYCDGTQQWGSNYVKKGAV